jgi:hypothetical protein
MDFCEGDIHLYQCDTCKRYFTAENICSNEETHIMECTECYIQWRMEQLKLKRAKDRP